MPDLEGQDSYAVTLFTATSIPAESKMLLENAELVGAPRNWNLKVIVTNTMVKLQGNKKGTVVIIK